ncbi:MAG: bifunctional 2-C-methyl-D-erythritol 4-phosphate cytidylyltransferase/2-C-methyl-D-erythritol 2,4-cyclodiphosphate synthase [Candidatus Puniceispirillaceae bacterium]
MPSAPSSNTRLDIILLAAGTGQRFSPEASGLPKQFQKLQQKSLIAHCLDQFLSWPKCGKIILVLPPDMANDLPSEIKDALAAYTHRITIIAGGESRADSALNGLIELDRAEEKSRYVAIHDAARPRLSHCLLDALKSALDDGAEGVIPVLPVSDTIRQKISDNPMAGSRVIDRNSLMRVQTPQAFQTGRILAAHQKLANAENKASFTDDAMIAEADGAKITLITGDEALKKITYAEDLTAMRQEMSQMETRTGSGYDVHKFSDEKTGPIMICGIAIPHPKGLLAHSDGDVGLHALCDAIFGALGTGDIGHFFPPSEARWKEAASDQFLKFASDSVKKAGGRIIHLDVTLICERPKIGPYREQMKDRLAEITGLASSRISVKATTSEGLGFTGRQEGIAAMAQATLSLPATE